MVGLVLLLSPRSLCLSVFFLSLVFLSNISLISASKLLAAFPIYIPSSLPNSLCSFLLVFPSAQTDKQMWFRKETCLFDSGRVERLKMEDFLHLQKQLKTKSEEKQDKCSQLTFLQTAEGWWYKFSLNERIFAENRSRNLLCKHLFWCLGWKSIVIILCAAAGQKVWCSQTCLFDLPGPGGTDPSAVTQLLETWQDSD